MIVIGAGQAGLAVGRPLVEAGVDVLVLDAAARIGDVWRRRGNSLRLFTAAKTARVAGWILEALRRSTRAKQRGLAVASA